MSKYTVQTSDEINGALAQLPHWSHDNDMLKASLKFSSFSDAMAFMGACAKHADQLDHHPDWSNCYNKVEIKLSTHDAGNRVTNLDLELAELFSHEFEAKK